jgi:YcxB-like protein
MQIEFELTQKDFREALITNRTRTPGKKWTFRIFLILLLGFWAFLFYGSLLAHSTRQLIPFLLLIIVWVAFIAALPWWSARRQFLKQPRAHGPRTLSLDASGVQWRWDGGSLTSQWKDYIRWVEGKSQILLYSSPVSFSFLPKRSLSPEQLNEVRTLLAQNIRTAK